MKLAVYHPWVYLKSGIERLLFELVERSRHDWTIYTHHYEPEATYPQLRNLRVVELQPSVSVRRSFGPLMRAAVTIATSKFPDDGAQAVLVSSEGLGDFVVNRNRIPAVCICHTPLKILHDPVTRQHLGASQAGKARALRVLGAPFSYVDRRMWRRFRHVFADSEEVRERIHRAGLVPSGDIEVLYPGVDLEHFRPGTAPRARRFVIAGRVMWQKRIENGIAAFALAREAGLDAELVVAGAVDRKSEPYFAALQEQAAGLPVHFEIHPADERMVELLQTSLALVMTAPNEDFGLVALEAMACGTPVLASNLGGPRESVVPGTTGWLVTPEPGPFADVMLHAGQDPSALAAMAGACRSRAEQFSWTGFVQRIDDVMEDVVKSSS